MDDGQLESPYGKGIYNKNALVINAQDTFVVGNALTIFVNWMVETGGDYCLLSVSCDRNIIQRGCDDTPPKHMDATGCFITNQPMDDHPQVKILMG
jgi:hypothetical protein